MATAVDDRAILALEDVAARAWPAPEVETSRGWQLRAAEGGFTRRANSARPMSVAAVDRALRGLDVGRSPLVDELVRWYAKRGRPAVLALPLPTAARLHERLLSAGWSTAGPTWLMTAPTEAVRASVRGRDPSVQVRTSEHPEEEWFRGYARGGADSPIGRHVLAGGVSRFATVHLDDVLAAVIRWSVEGSWIGVAPLEVLPDHRRRGLAKQLLARAADDGLDRGATSMWVQVESANEAAVALYHGLGFEVHHEYWYDIGPDEGAET